MSRSNRTCLLVVLSVCASTILTVAQAATQTGYLISIKLGSGCARLRIEQPEQ